MKEPGDVLRELLAEELRAMKDAKRGQQTAFATSAIVIAATFLVLTESVVAYLEKRHELH